MGSAGTVVSVDIPVNAAGKSKGFATIKYDSVESARQAVQTLNDAELSGRKLLVKQDTPKPVVADAAPTASGSSTPKGTGASGRGVYIGNLAYAGACSMFFSLSFANYF